VERISLGMDERFAHAVVLIFFSAMALVELNIARGIVIIGFSVVIITLAVITVLVFALGGGELLKKTITSIEDKKT
jgi:hypothetical protein